MGPQQEAVRKDEGNRETSRRRYDIELDIGGRKISSSSPTYIIADIASNHDGELERAKKLIALAATCGADCVKFQHFRAKDIVSAKGFEKLKIAHQAAWDKPVYEMYEQYSINRDWDEELADECIQFDVHFMTTPYDLGAIQDIDDLVYAYKIGSGDITYTKLINAVARMGKPTFMATGASSMDDVQRAVDVFLTNNRKLCLMQCNTNYTGSYENFKHVNLNVLHTYSYLWPDLTLGLSDHTPGHSTVLGAVALGARVIEKHFTDDNTRSGPDHGFALTPKEWTAMVKSVRELEMAFGDGVKMVEENEVESAIVQRRALRVNENLMQGAMITAEKLDSLRPCPVGAFTPADIGSVIGKRVKRAVDKGGELYPEDVY